MEPNTFDELTKTLATATSRRQALRRIGGILGGTALAGLFPGLALASNSNCAHFCNAVFGGDTPASAQCATDAAHGTGLCYSCGPASLGGSQPICCQENPDGTCSSYSGTTCCGSSATCLNGSCCTKPTCVALSVWPLLVTPTSASRAIQAPAPVFPPAPRAKHARTACVSQSPAPTHLPAVPRIFAPSPIAPVNAK